MTLRSTEEAALNVAISDARYTNPDTGETVTSHTYHMLDTGCLADSPHRLEVPEEVAQAFGRTLCRICIGVEKRRQAQAVIASVLRDMFGEDDIFKELAERLPPQVEMRLLWRDPNKKHPKMIWTSHPKGD